MTRLRFLGALLLALVLVAAGCGSDDGGGSDEEGSAEEPSSQEEAEEPEGQVLVEDEFEDDENLWEPDSLDIEGEQDLSIDDGTLTVEVEADGYEGLEDDQLVIPNQLWPTVLDGVAEDLQDVRVEAEVSFETPGSTGLACRIADPSPDATDLGAYFFQVASSGVVNIARLDAEGANLDALETVPELEEGADIDELPVEDAAFEFEDGEPVELALTCVDGDDGVELTGFIDGEEVVSATDDDDPIESGQVGVTAGQSGIATDVEGFEPYEISVESATITNLGDEIDEEDLEAASAQSPLIPVSRRPPHRAP
jgi:hypothetical protein